MKKHTELHLTLDNPKLFAQICADMHEAKKGDMVSFFVIKPVKNLTLSHVKFMTVLQILNFIGLSIIEKHYVKGNNICSRCGK